MSGGHWDYQDFNVTEFLNDAGQDIKHDYQILGPLLVGLSSVLQKMFHDIDWDYSGDHIIKDKREYESKTIKKIVKKIDLAVILDELIETKQEELNYLKTKREKI